MRKKPFIAAVLVIATALLAVPEKMVTAADPGGWRFPFRLTGWGKAGSVDLKTYKCDECGQVHGADFKCIERVPIQECVVGKKKVFDSTIRYEYVSIPEVRYRWKTKWVTREIPCEYCKPVCKTEDGQNCYGTEKWASEDAACSKLHCRIIQPQLEKAPCKYCECEPGETTVKVRYKTCVKEPYTVYRQVKRPICVKLPRYEKVEVPITRHECRDLKCQTCKSCAGAGCASCAAP